MTSAGTEGRGRFIVLEGGEGAGKSTLSGALVARLQEAGRDAIAVLPRPHDRFDPRMDASTRGRLYAGWQAAVARAVLDPSAV